MAIILTQKKKVVCVWNRIFSIIAVSSLDRKAAKGKQIEIEMSLGRVVFVYYGNASTRYLEVG